MVRRDWPRKEKARASNLPVVQAASVSASSKQEQADMGKEAKASADGKGQWGEGVVRRKEKSRRCSSQKRSDGAGR